MRVTADTSTAIQDVGRQEQKNQTQIIVGATSTVTTLSSSAENEIPNLIALLRRVRATVTPSSDI